MNKVHLFILSGYYPTGFDDYVGSFETYEQAREHALRNQGYGDYFQIIGHQEDGSLELLGWEHFPARQY